MRSSLLHISVLFAFLFSSCKSKTTFELLSSEDTGIHFSNQINENDTLHILKYEYLYNGSGVGMGDFNNDGLTDLLFSGNQANATLYMNKGDMKFEDVSKKVGINTLNRWCAGVSIVDINGDGLVSLTDFYIIRTNFNKTGQTREQGDLTGDGLVSLADFYILRQYFGA